jgi:hypothetical protein
VSERKADQLAGKGSFADKLRRQRLAIEAGDLDAAREVFTQADAEAGAEVPEEAQSAHSRPRDCRSAVKWAKSRPGNRVPLRFHGAAPARKWVSPGNPSGFHAPTRPMRSCMV